MKLQEIAEARKQHVVDCLLDLVCEDSLKSEWKTPRLKTDMQSIKEIANAAFTVPGVSDGGAHTKFSTIGRYSTEFLEHVRDRDLMDLDQAHWRLSKYPAQAAGLLDRGHLAEGM